MSATVSIEQSPVLHCRPLLAVAMYTQHCVRVSPQRVPHTLLPWQQEEAQREWL